MKFFNTSGVKYAWEYRDDPSSMRALATVFWRTLLAVMVLLLLLAIWFGSQELNAASQAESVTTTSAPIAQPITVTQLNSTLSSLSARSSDYQTLSQSPLPQVVDPSK